MHSDKVNEWPHFLKLHKLHVEAGSHLRWYDGVIANRLQREKNDKSQDYNDMIQFNAEHVISSVMVSSHGSVW